MSPDRRNLKTALAAFSVVAGLTAAGVGIAAVNNLVQEGSKEFSSTGANTCNFGDELVFPDYGVLPVKEVLANSRGIQLCLTAPLVAGRVYQGPGIAIESNYQTVGKNLLGADPMKPGCVTNDSIRVCAIEQQTTDKDGKTSFETKYRSDIPVMENDTGYPTVFTAQTNVMGRDGKLAVVMGVNREPHSKQQPPPPPWTIPAGIVGALGTATAGMMYFIARKRTKQANEALAVRDAALGTAAIATQNQKRAQAVEANTLHRSRQLDQRAQEAIRERDGLMNQVADLTKKNGAKDHSFNAATATIEELKRQRDYLQEELAKK